MIFMVRLTSKSPKMRRKEARKYFVLPGELKTARETQLKDAAYVDSRGRRVISEGELSAVVRGIEENKFYAVHGTPEEKKKALKRIPLYEDILRDLLFSAKKHGIKINGEAVSRKREEIRAELEKKLKKPSPYEQAKMRLKKALEKVPK